MDKNIGQKRNNIVSTMLINVMMILSKQNKFEDSLKLLQKWTEKTNKIITDFKKKVSKEVQLVQDKVNSVDERVMSFENRIAVRINGM